MYENKFFQILKQNSIASQFYCIFWLDTELEIGIVIKRNHPQFPSHSCWLSTYDKEKNVIFVKLGKWWCGGVKSCTIKLVGVQLHTALTIFGTDQLWWERSLIELVLTWLMVLSKIHGFQRKVRSAKIFSNKFQSKGRRRKYLAGSSLTSKTSFEGSVHKAALCGWKLVDKLLRHSLSNS